MPTPLRQSQPQIDPVVGVHDLFREAEQRFRSVFNLERVVAANRSRALILARHVVLKRRLVLRVHLEPDTKGRTWFERESELLAMADHPGIRPVYSAGYRGDWAYRTSKWIEGESLGEAVARGVRTIPHVLQLARDLLSALEYVHADGIVVRRITPTALMLDTAGRAIVTDLRWADRLLDVAEPDGDQASGAYMAPEVRDGSAGEPTADLYCAASLLYCATTGTDPDPDPDAIVPPRELRAACPQALQRVILRALQAVPGDRYLTAGEMGDDLISDLGPLGFEGRVPPAVHADDDDDDAWEKRLRRALGDDYELLRQLGAGGFGRVYVVRDLALEREVALKVLHPALTDSPDVVERFRREARLAASLNHPHIVDVFDIGGRAGLLWYTMAYVEGENLAQRVERSGPASIETTVRMLREGLSALEHAHGQDLVHRDLKPENLLIARADGRIAITDFGLALALRGHDAAGAASRSGTPAFAAPEQLLGESVDRRADLYSLALVGVYALTGRPPFGEGRSEVILARQAAGTFPDIRARNPDVPPELVRVLRTAASKDVYDRYESAEEFHTALRDAMRRARYHPLRWLKRLFRFR